MRIPALVLVPFGVLLFMVGFGGFNDQGAIEVSSPPPFFLGAALAGLAAVVLILLAVNTLWFIAGRRKAVTWQGLPGVLSEGQDVPLVPEGRGAPVFPFFAFTWEVDGIEFGRGMLWSLWSRESWQPQRLGEIQADVATLVIRDVFGFYTLRVPWRSHAQVVVRPKLQAVDRDALPPSIVRTEEESRLHSMAKGDDYRIRNYVAGDDVRRIHWKLTAKTGDILVREPEPTMMDQQDLVVVPIMPDLPALGRFPHVEQDFRRTAYNALEDLLKAYDSVSWWSWRRRDYLTDAEAVRNDAAALRPEPLGNLTGDFLTQKGPWRGTLTGIVLVTHPLAGQAVSGILQACSQLDLRATVLVATVRAPAAMNRSWADFWGRFRDWRYWIFQSRRKSMPRLFRRRRAPLPQLQLPSGTETRSVKLSS